MTPWPPRGRRSGRCWGCACCSPSASSRRSCCGGPFKAWTADASTGASACCQSGICCSPAVRHARIGAASSSAMRPCTGAVTCHTIAILFKDGRRGESSLLLRSSFHRRPSTTRAPRGCCAWLLAIGGRRRLKQIDGNRQAARRDRLCANDLLHLEQSANCVRPGGHPRDWTARGPLHVVKNTGVAEDVPCGCVGAGADVH